MKNNYQVFVASSLRLQEHRAAACAAIEQANELVMDKDLSFSEFVYEKRPDINQILEKEDAQAPADMALRESALFFLIIDEKIRSLTQYEFELALEYFNRGELPQYIYIFYNEEAEKQSDADGLSYADFKKDENLNRYLTDNQNDIVTHSRVYAIPFTTVDSLKKKMTEKLLAFSNSSDRPFSGALRGSKLTKDHFFTDIRRKEKCVDLYLRRETDDELDDAIKNRKFVVITAPSLSGKTRAMMEALRAVDDGWVYILRQDDADGGHLVREIKRLLRYLNEKNHPKLYIALDNLDLWTQDEEVADVLDKLVERIWDSNAVIVGTASSKDISLPGFNPQEDSRVACIEIKEMDEHDFAAVRDFFVSAGVQIDERNLHYRRTGALFVDLNDILSEYRRWADNGSEAMLLAKRMLLTAIKALSIWRDDYMGDRGLMMGLATWLCMQDTECQWTEVEMAYLCRQSLKNLLRNRRMGVWSAGEHAPVIVQEYIYRYFIDYDGSLLSDGTDFTPEGERELTRKLLSYCKEMHDKEPERMEPLTAQASRIARRCNFKKQTVEWLYKLWAGRGEVAQNDAPLAEMLRYDREACEKSGDERIAHFYSVLVQTFIYQGYDGMDGALQAYGECPVKMRTDHLLSALMRMAKTQEERDKIKEMDDYKAMENQPYVIAAEVEWAEDYNQAKNTFARFARNETAAEIARRLLDEKKTKKRAYDILQLRRAAGTLATKVSVRAEYEDYCDTLRAYYLYLVCDTKVLRQIRDHEMTYSPEQLTLIDLLAVLQPYPLRCLAKNVFGGEMDASKAFTDSLTHCVEATLKGPFTDETSVRLTVSFVTSLLIRSLADAPYDEVYDNIFNPLKMAHPLNEGKPLILRSTYTYTAMMGNRYCEAEQANNLLENDLIPHTMGAADNPLTINTYTLNMMMDKSKGEKKRMYARMIDKLYDQLHKQRDSFTYSRLIAMADSLQESLGLMKQMIDQGIKANVFILIELMKRPDVTLAQALGFLNLADIDLPEGYVYEKMEWRQTGKGGTTFDPNDVIEQLRPQMSELQVAWGNVFKKRCTKEEGAVLKVCLSYLEDKRPELMKGGVVYNNYITNVTCFPTVYAIMEFVKEKAKGNLFHPDSYTAKHVIDRILDMNGQERLKAIDRLNELLVIAMKGKADKLDNVIVCHRLKIYPNQQDALKMVFFDGKGNMEERKTSAIGYVEAMHEYGHPVNYYAIRNLLNIEKDRNDNTYIRLMEVLMWQQVTYTYQPKDLKIIRERCVGYYEAYADMIPALKKPLTAHEYNKALVWKVCEEKEDEGKEDAEKAMGSLDWNNPNSAICSFNDILEHVIDKKRKDGLLIFSDILSYYDRYVKEAGHAPTSHTIAILAKATACWADMQQLLDEYDLQKKTNSRLTLESSLLSNLSSFSDTVSELKQRTCAMHAKGCAFNKTAANNYVFRIATRLLTLDTAPATDILDDLLHYVVEGGDVRQMLQEDERVYLMLDMFAEPQNVSPELLRTLIYYNAARQPTPNPTPNTSGKNGDAQLYSHEAMLECIRKKYPSCIIPLLYNLNRDASAKNPVLPLRERMDAQQSTSIKDMIAREYIPVLFDAIPEGSRPSLPGWQLGNMMKNLRYKMSKIASLQSIDTYKHFTARLYETDWRDIDEAVPSMVSFLKDYIRHFNAERSPEMTAIRKTLAQIIVYADLNKLRNGHLLIDRAPEQYAKWCFRFMDSKRIRQQLEKMHVYESLFWSQIIKYHADRLDDAFPCSLKIFKKYTAPTVQMDEDVYTLIREQEQRYAQSILSGDVYFSEVLKLPILWINARWKPSCKLVMAMIASLTRVAWNPGIHETYQKDALQRLAHIEEAFNAACRDKEKTVVIYYWHLALLHPNDIHTRKIPLPLMGRHLYDLYLDHYGARCTNGTHLTRQEAALLRNAEKACVRCTIPEKEAFEWLQQLPERWVRICDEKGKTWIPSPGMVTSMLRHYLRMAKGKEKEAGMARSIVRKVKKSMEYARNTHHDEALIYYNIFSPSLREDKSFVKVSLSALEKIIVD